MISPAVPVAALLPLAAAAVYILWGSGAIRNLFKPPRPVQQRQADMFLNKMVHKTYYEDVRFVSFRIDCFLFDFKPWHPDGLDQDVQYGFLDYARTLDLANQQAIVKLMIWLEQRRVRFRLRYQWNSSLPFTYNIRQIKKPGMLRKLVASIDRDLLMAYDLSKDTHALHP